MFHSPLWFIALLIPVAVGLLWNRSKQAVIRFPSTEGLRETVRAGRPINLQLLRLLRVVVLVLIVAGLARPRQGLETNRIRAEGIDIILVVDVSTSMLAEDFTLNGERQNRLDVVKTVVKEFIENRTNDRIGLVIFGGRAYTQCPLTLDHGWLLNQLKSVHIGSVEDGTAIGSGITTGLNRIRDSSAKSRIMVLLTDGVNNTGDVSPQTAAQLAKALDVKIYTIGAGTKGDAPYPTKDIFGRSVYSMQRIEVDDEGLTEVAVLTGGKYFRATDTDSLKQTYKDIDRLEKTELEQPKYMTYKEWYPWAVVPALLLLLLEVILGQTWLRVLP